MGSTLSIGLKQRYPNYRIIALDNLRRRGSELNLLRLKEAEVEFVHGDIRNPEDLVEFTQLYFILDASADPSVLSGINSPVMPLIQANLNGTVNCLELAQRTGAAFVFLSTSRIYPIKNLESASFEELETYLPVYHKDQMLAILFLKRKSQDRELDLDFTQALTNILVVALENKRFARKQLQQERFPHGHFFGIRCSGRA